MDWAQFLDGKSTARGDDGKGNNHDQLFSLKEPDCIYGFALSDGQPQSARNDIFNPRTRLAPSVDMIDVKLGESLAIKARNPEGITSPELTLAWPLLRIVTEK